MSTFSHYFFLYIQPPKATTSLLISSLTVPLHCLTNMGTVCGGIVDALNANLSGNGTQTLVLAHGFGTDQTVWHYLIPFLACYFKILVFDLAFTPNATSSLYNPNKYSTLDAYAEDLVCLLDELNLNKTIYVGHSMSAMIGSLAATKRPQLFQHLILLGASPRLVSLLLFIFVCLKFYVV